MKTQECFWSLFKGDTGTRIDGLKTVQARAVVTIIPQLEHGLWWAWREGAAEWVQLTDAQDLFECSNEMIILPPIAPPPPASVGKIAALRANNSGQIFDTRLNSRFIKHFDLQIEYNDVYLQAKTQDVSLGGLAVQSILPTDLIGRVRVRIFRKTEVVDVIASVVPITKNEPVSRLKFLSVSNIELLRSWLLDSGID